MTENLRIELFGFFEDDNIGDPVIGETCKYLIERICRENNILATVNKNPLFPPPNFKKYWITRFLRYRFRKDPGEFKRIFAFLVLKFHNLFNPLLRNYYKRIIKNADMVIFAGGGMLKYRSQEFWAADYMILNYCEKYNVPVYFNAIGIEGYDESNFISRLIKKLINKKCVKAITTRDDIISLKKYIPSISDDNVVGDPALYSNELYIPAKQTDIIGVGTIRCGIFHANGIMIEEDELIEFYCEIIKRLQNKNYKWQLFTNGTVGDYNLALKTLEKMNIEPNNTILAKRPENSGELINLITSYKGIIANRMHAHIIATSFNIPAVGLIWNNKIKWFAKHIGCPERFFEASEMKDYDRIFETFEKALNEGDTKLNTSILKEKTYKKLEEFILNKEKENK